MEKLLNRSGGMFTILVLFAVVLIFVPGCKSTRTITRTKILEKPSADVYHHLMNQQASFHNLSMRMAIVVHTDANQSTNVKAQVRIKSDSLIWCSLVPAMGIEIARVQISHDSVKLINRMKKNYVMGSYHLLDSLLHAAVNYQGMEALLLAKPLRPLENLRGIAPVDGSFYQLHFPEGSYDTLHANQSGLQQTVWVDPQTFLIKKMLVKEPNNQNRFIRVFYDGYSQVNGKYFPSNIKIFIFAQKKMQIDVVVRKLELKNNLTFPFNIPQNYVKL
jgi:hypothetical protein